MTDPIEQAMRELNDASLSLKEAMEFAEQHPSIHMDEVVQLCADRVEQARYAYSTACIQFGDETA